jgi:hypothetical protein
MNRWLCQLRLAIGAGFCFAAGSAAWAQAPASAPTPPLPLVAPGPGVPAPAVVVTEQPLAVASPDRPRPFQHVHDALHRYGLGCFATIDTVGCTSLGSELTFIFGSCRAFFQEPCAPGGGLTHGGCGPNGCP